MILRRALPALAMLIAVTVMVAQQPNPAAAAGPSGEVTILPRTLSPIEAEARRLYGAMDLRQRVAQMVIGVANGDVYSRQSEEFEKYRHWIEDLEIGGLIVNNSVEFGSARNANPFAMAVFLNQMQEMSKAPLLVASDFERAASMRVTGGTAFPHSMAIAAGGDIEAAWYEGLVSAREARALGVHWIFAPVADVNNNPDNPIINLRSYGEEPERVADYVAAFIEGAHSDPGNHVMVTAKHFPGHGDTGVDSHLGLPRLGATRDRLDKIELVPFRRAIQAGVDSIMTAHMALPQLAPSGVPATVAPEILTDLLRKDLGFEKIIVTDAMTMRGLTLLFPDDEASVRSVEAGADVLLMPNDPESAIQAVVDAVESGRIPEKRIEESALRILEAKAELGLIENRMVDLNGIADHMESPEAAERAQEMADHAITLLKNDNGVLPLSPRDRVCLITINSLRISEQGQRLIREFRRRNRRGRVVTIDNSMPLGALDAIRRGAGQCDAVVVASFASITADLGDVADFLYQLIDDATPVVLVGTNDPYLYSSFADVDAYLNSYSSAPPSEYAIAKALFGDIAITGRTPVTIPELALVGDGIQMGKDGKEVVRAGDLSKDEKGEGSAPGLQDEH